MNLTVTVTTPRASQMNVSVKGATTTKMSWKVAEATSSPTSNTHDTTFRDVHAPSVTVAGTEKGNTLSCAKRLRHENKQTVQISSRWHFCARKSPHALHPVSHKFPRRCLSNSSNVRLIDDGPLSSFQGKSPTASSFHAFLLQAMCGTTKSHHRKHLAA